MKSFLLTFLLALSQQLGLTFCLGILSLLFPKYHFDTIFCSPPCTQFSRALTTGPRNIEEGDKIVQKALEIIQYFQPKRWFLENLRTGLLKDRPYMKNIPYIDIYYCQFSDWGYQKPTRIWGDQSISSLQSKVCDFFSCINLIDRPNGRKGHKEILGSMKMKYSRNQKYRVPESLIYYLCQWPELEALDKATSYIHAMQLDPFLEIRFGGLGQNIIPKVAEHLHSIGQLQSYVQSVVTVNDPLKASKLEIYGNKLLRTTPTLFF